jgi:multiple sugar transport system substrate-binding protein
MASPSQVTQTGVSATGPGETGEVSQKLHLARRRLFAQTAALSGSWAMVALAGCGTAAGGTSTAPKLSQTKGKIVFYTRGGEVETRGQADILIPTFKKVAPNVEVVHEVFQASNPDDSYTLKLYAMYAANTPPDVFGFGQNYMGFWARGMLSDLTPLINRDKYDLSQFLTGLPDKFKVHGKHYGIPQLTTFGTLLFYNKTLFDNEGIKYPPVDWDDRSWTYDKMLETARKLTKNPGTPEAVYGLNYGPQRPTQYAWNFGGEAYLPEHWTDGIAQRTQVDSEASVRGHEFAQDLRWKHQVAPRSGTDPTTGINFIGGRYAMQLDGGWNFWGYTVIKDFKWGAAAVPYQANNKNVAYNDFWELGSQTKVKDAAWEFIKHLASADVQKEYSNLTGTPPTNKAAIDTWYKRYEGIMTRAELEKCVQGAIDPKRSQESADHLFIDWSQLSTYYGKEFGTPLDRREGSPKEIITRAKPGYDALTKEIYDRYKGKTPN